MKYLGIPELETINAELNFNNDAVKIEGQCELYTTKSAGNDKKLYKELSRSIEAR